MRPWSPLLLCLLAVSCASPSALWHRPSQEELDRAAVEERENDALQQRQLAEKRRKLDAVMQAFSLHDVRNCKRLGLVSYQSLDDARHAAVKMGGNRILAQRRRSYFYFHHPRGVDDYEIFSCASPPDASQ
jgi:hypothetical protein